MHGEGEGQQGYCSPLTICNFRFKPAGETINLNHEVALPPPKMSSMGGDVERRLWSYQQNFWGRFLLGPEAQAPLCTPVNPALAVGAGQLGSSL
jgi:hypothetical protein